MAFCCQLYLSLKDAPRTTDHGHGSPGHHLSKGCASAVSVVLLKLGSFIIVSFLFAFVFVSLSLFTLSSTLLGISYFSSVTVNVCYERRLCFAGEDFMPLPGDFKLINHIKCFAVPSPESRVPSWSRLFPKLCKSKLLRSKIRRKNNDAKCWHNYASLPRSANGLGSVGSGMEFAALGSK